MALIKLQKRSHDFFVSYGHDDMARVREIADWLRRVCGLELWLDSAEGSAAKRSSELLANAIGNCRGAMFFLSEKWKLSSWCRDEHEIALTEKRRQEGFEIVAVRLDAAEPPPWFQRAEIVDLREVGIAALARLLRSLSSEVPHRFDNDQDVYLAAPWSRPSSVARMAFEALRDEGWRLIGDPRDSGEMSERRLEAVIRTTRGMVALLPYDPAQHSDPSQPGTFTSPFIVEEARIALDNGRPLLLLAEKGVVPPADVAQRAFRGGAFTLNEGEDGRAVLKSLLEDFDEMLQRVVHDDRDAYVFHCASPPDIAGEDVASVIERACNMRCLRGERMSGDHVQAAIVDAIRRAAVVIADVTEDHRSPLIEAGIAMGAGTRLKLIAMRPPEGPAATKRPMFEGQEFFWYGSAEERLGLTYFLARQFRRRVYVLR